MRDFINKKIIDLGELISFAESKNILNFVDVKKIYEYIEEENKKIAK